MAESEQGLTPEERELRAWRKRVQWAMAIITAVKRAQTPEERARLAALVSESAVTMRRNLALLVATDGDVEAVYQRLATMENP